MKPVAAAAFVAFLGMGASDLSATYDKKHVNREVALTRVCPDRSDYLCVLAEAQKESRHGKQ